MSIQIRKATTLRMSTEEIRGIRTLEAKDSGSRKWNVAGDSNGIFDFASEEDRDAKIAELVEAGAILKPAK
jgi:hypothetical protein